MGKPVNPSYRFCEKAGRNVSIEQTEGQCREYHNCSDDSCPLEAEFGQGKFDRALKLLVPGLQDGRK